MNNAMMLAVPFISGALLGAVFFLGLRWTVSKLAGSRTPALLVAGSLLIRTVVILLGFYFVSAGHWERLTACLGGFVIARIVVVRLTAPSISARSILAKRTSYAP